MHRLQTSKTAFLVAAANWILLYCTSSRSDAAMKRDPAGHVQLPLWWW